MTKNIPIDYYWHLFLCELYVLNAEHFQSLVKIQETSEAEEIMANISENQHSIDHCYSKIAYQEQKGSTEEFVKTLIQAASLYQELNQSKYQYQKNHHDQDLAEINRLKKELDELKPVLISGAKNIDDSKLKINPYLEYFLQKIIT